MKNIDLHLTYPNRDKIDRFYNVYYEASDLASSIIDVLEDDGSDTYAKVSCKRFVKCFYKLYVTRTGCIKDDIYSHYNKYINRKDERLFRKLIYKMIKRYVESNIPNSLIYHVGFIKSPIEDAAMLIYAIRRI